MAEYRFRSAAAAASYCCRSSSEMARHRAAISRVTSASAEAWLALAFSPAPASAPASAPPSAPASPASGARAAVMVGRTSAAKKRNAERGFFGSLAFSSALSRRAVRAAWVSCFRRFSGG